MPDHEAKGIASNVFSVLPLTRAHMVLPRAVLSAPVPETKTIDIPGFSFKSVVAAAIANSQLMRV